MTNPQLTVTTGSSGLKIEKLRKSYRKKTVIRDVSMTLDRSEVVALLGPNGSGKTTTFYSIAGLVFPEAGTVTIDGQNATTLPMYRRARLGIGYLPQEMSIFRGLSVEENISAVLDITVKHAHKRKERLEELLSDFSIEHLRRAPALALSGGERRRVEIARCLAADPKYLLLDEPFAALGPALRNEMLDLVRVMAAQTGAALVMVTHSPDDVRRIADEVIFVEGGRAHAPRPAAALMDDPPPELRAYLGQE